MKRYLLIDLLNEAMGVPKGLPEVGDKVYNALISKLENTTQNLLDKPLMLGGDFSFGDIELDTVEITIDDRSSPNYDLKDDFTLIALGITTYSNVNKKIQLVTNTSPIPKITIEIAMGRNYLDKSNIMSDITNFFKAERLQLIKSLTHELKHYYDDVKTPSQKIISRAKYNSYLSIDMNYIKPMGKFLYYLYYIHNAENLVRPSEVAAHMMVDKVSKKDFYQFLTQHEVFKTLKNIQSFSYDKLIEKLEGNLDKIKEVLDDNNVSYNAVDPEGTIEKFLNVVVDSLKNEQVEFGYKNIQPLRYKNVPIDSFFKKYKAEVRKYKTGEAFIRNEEKNFKNISTKLLKKLSKLYDMSIDENIKESKSIINWEAWHVAHNTSTKLKK